MLRKFTDLSCDARSQWNATLPFLGKTVVQAFLAIFLICNNAIADEATSSAQVTTILLNGKIFTGADGKAFQETIVTKGGEIVFVGSSEKAQNYVTPEARVGDLEGRLVLPGFIDSHLHLMLGAAAKSGVWLAGTQTVEDVVAMLRDYSDENDSPDLIFGWGYPETFLSPKKEDLDAAFPNTGVYLVRSDGHSAWANSKAFELAGVDKDTPDPAPPAGTLGRLESGELSGAINGGPANLWMVRQLPNLISQAQIERAALPIIDHVSEVGITAPFDAGAPVATDQSFEFLVKLDDSKGLPFRYEASYYINSSNQADGAIEELERLSGTYESENFHINTLKITTDGVMENRKAALLQPYDDGGGSGAMNFDDDTINSLTLEAAAKGYNIYMHTLGDLAVRKGLNAAERLRSKGFDQTLITLSHVQLLAPEDRPRFAENDVILNSTGEWMHYFGGEETYLGSRVFSQYPYKTLFEQGVIFASGSDFPAHPNINPMDHIEVLVTRRPVGAFPSVKPLNEGETMSVEDAVRSYTINGAKLLGLDSKIGTLEVGKRADLVVLDENIFDVDANKIHKTSVILTVMDGIVRHGELFGW